MATVEVKKTVTLTLSESEAGDLMSIMACIWGKHPVCDVTDRIHSALVDADIQATYFLDEMTIDGDNIRENK